ncbi:MAG: GNAT family N-acetyltransferase [Candidatus Pacearchaeota archaeon]|jgi:hypothetical protein
MHINDITYSSDKGKITQKDLNESSKISEDYFGTQKDSNQIPTTRQTRDWIYKNAQDYLNIIRSDGEMVGYTFMLPCNRILMDCFLSKKINEAELFEEIKKMKLKDTPETIYLCAAVLKEEFRGKGLATTAFVKAINKIIQNGKNKPILFYWKYSEEGGKLSQRVAKFTGLELKIRAD